MKDAILNLNTNAIRHAIRMVLDDQGQDVRLVEVEKNRIILVNDEKWFVYDRHFHYPRKMEHPYALYEFLKAVADLALKHPVAPRYKPRKRGSHASV